jgi:hypothetical protein
MFLKTGWPYVNICIIKQALRYRRKLKVTEKKRTDKAVFRTANSILAIGVFFAYKFPEWKKC